MKNRISILFYTKSAKASKDGLLPIYLRITVDGVRIEVSTSKYVEKSKWSVEGGKMKGNSEEARTINSYLDILKNKVYETEKSMINNNQEINALSFKNKFLGIEEKQRMLIPIFQEHNKRMKALVDKEFALNTYKRFALDSTSISCSINLLTWAEGKYSRGAVKVHTLLDLRGSIPAFILVTDGKYHDSNMLDVMNFVPDAIYLMYKAYVDFEGLYEIHLINAFFVTRAKSSMKYTIIEQNFNIEQNTGITADKTVELTVVKSRKLYPEKIRLVEYYDSKKR